MNHPYPIYACYFRGDFQLPVPGILCLKTLSMLELTFSCAWQARNTTEVMSKTKRASLSDYQWLVSKYSSTLALEPLTYMLYTASQVSQGDAAPTSHSYLLDDTRFTDFLPLFCLTSPCPYCCFLSSPTLK